MTDPTTPPAGPRKAAGSSFLPLAVVALLVVAAAGFYGYVRYTEGSVPPADDLAQLRPFAAELAKQQRLAPGYADADGDKVPDPPADPAKLLDPAELRFVGIPSDYADKPDAGAADWKPFLDHLAAATGKKVAFADDIKTYEDQLAALRDGRLHVTAFSTGQVPAAVNTAGFVPLACPADAAGKFSYEMELLVRPDSPVKTPADLRGKEVAFSTLSSNSGSRAPMKVLGDEFGLLPGRDYRYPITGDQLVSLKGLAAGKFDAVCVANDYFRRLVADPENKLTAGQFRSVYTSKSFPPICFGAAYNLKPELRAKAAGAFAGFAVPPDTKLAGRLRQPKFAPVDYKRDWAYVLEVDESLARLLGGR